jgi:hypothetical protein
MRQVLPKPRWAYLAVDTHEGVYGRAGAEAHAVEGCFIDSQTGSGMNCGVSTTVSTGNQRVRVETRTWAGQNEDDAFFIYVDVGNENFATLWSYDTE